MNLELYKPTDLEQWINMHYRQHGIFQASNMDIELIAESFGIELHIYAGPSFADWRDDSEGYRLIALDKRQPERERRAEFFHELTHPLRHCGRQNDLPEPFVELQEIQAAKFQLAAALPVYMLRGLPEAPPGSYGKMIAEEFQLPLTLVMRRLEQIHARILDSQCQRRRFQVPPGIDISKPHILDAIIQLRGIQRRKRGAADL